MVTAGTVIYKRPACVIVLVGVMVIVQVAISPLTLELDVTVVPNRAY